MSRVVVLGIGQSQFGKFKELTAAQLGTQAAKAAISDAGIEAKAIQVVYGSSVLGDPTLAQTIMKDVGVTEVEMNNVENACGSGISAANLLYRDIANGVYDIGIAVGTESMTRSLSGGGVLSPPDLDGKLGQSMPTYFALIARRLMEQGATMEDLAFPTVKNHKNACLNPYAMYKKEISVEEAVQSRMVADPITLLECCPYTDGAAAVIMCSEEVARRYTTKPIFVASSVISSGCYDDPDIDILEAPSIRRLAAKAYNDAGIGPEDLNVVELHDAFSPEEIWTYEALGLCPRGEAIPFMRSGATSIGGKLPVNPSGGLLSLGHPMGASGVRVICEIALHLRGDAGARQTPNAKVGMAEMIGGYVGGLAAPVAGGIQILTK